MNNNVNIKLICADAKSAMTKLIEIAKLDESQIVVVGCSTSEIIGEKIGSCSSVDVAKELIEALKTPCAAKNLFLAIQCCEHLNRALVVERACALQYSLEIVTVRPISGAGGALAQMAYDHFDDPVVVEFIQAHAGMDIGNTIIGMHLRHVAVPTRLSITKIGCAPVVFARTRHKYIGGPRAQYENPNER